MNEPIISRREMMAAMGGLAVSGTLGHIAQAAAEERANILFVMTDDHAAHAVSCYGSRINTTPNLDRLAREGMKFENCFVTNALCAPSRATLLTGKYGHLNGVPDNAHKFDGSQQTFPKLLRAGGYRTGLIGKWHLQSSPTGFDEWSILPGQGIYNNPVLIEMGKKRQHQGYVTDIITDLSIDFLKRNHNQPFCLLCHHKAPHREWNPHPKHAGLFADRDIPEPPTFKDDYQNRASAAAHADMRIAEMPDYVGKGLPEGLSIDEKRKWNYQRFIKDYLRTIASVDDSMGRLLEYLDTAGLSRNTLVVYASDNGFFLGDHGWFDKRFMYEHSIRVPLLMRYPQLIKPGSTDSHLVMNLDYAPTFLDIAGVPIPADMQGRSLKPLMNGAAPSDWRTSIYCHYYEYPMPHRARPHYGVRTDRYKLIFYYTINEWELFDLQKDPNEMRNAYADPEYADTVRKLKEELQRLRRQYKDET